MAENTLVLGYGPVGRSVVDLLRKQARPVRVAQRSRPEALPDGVPFTACDVLDGDSVRAAMQGVHQIVVAIGFPYVGRIWERAWPVAMRKLLDGCADVGARMVFLDNLYMYGPLSTPLVETMPLSDQGRKPAVRTYITKMWQDDRRVKVAALRAPDFYGPGVTLSHLGKTGLAAVARSKAATFAFSPYQPHDYAYVPDMGRAVVTLLDAGDEAFGQASHMPCAPTLSSREILLLGAACSGAKLRVRSLPPIGLNLLSPFVPFLRELREMRFQWDRPYRVDATKWTSHFWSDVTSFDAGVGATIASFAA